MPVMSAGEESGAYLGGIGTMLEVADVCPACGETHNDRQYAFLHRGSGQCPALIESSYAIVSRPETPVEANLVPAVQPSEGSEIPVSIGSLPVPRREFDGERRSRVLTLPWLTPPDLGGVF
jgi:hypothetical protein